MSIQFNEIPAGNLVPMFMTEFDNTNAVKAGAMPWKSLLVGQAKIGANDAGLVKITRDDQADEIFGEGTQLALMIKAYRKNTKVGDLYALAVADKESSSAATFELDVTATNAKSGQINMLIGGVSVTASVSANDDASAISNKIVTAVNEVTDCPVAASLDSQNNTLTLTAKTKGTCGSLIDIRFNHNQGEEFPSGVNVSKGNTTAGTDDPVYNFGSLISGIWFNSIAIGSAETNNINYVKDLLNERWTATIQQTGVVFIPNAGTLEETTEKGSALNSQVIVAPTIANSPSLGYVIAAATMGSVVPHAINDPAMPLSNWEVKGVVAPKDIDKLSFEENNDVLKAGCALLTSQDDGSVWLKRIVTTYKTTPNGAKDTSYQQLEKVFTLSYLRWDWNNYMAGRYPHAKLADDGTDFGAGQVVMTPSLGKAELLGKYQEWIEKGLVQNFDEFKENLVVCRDPDDDTAMQFLIPADLVDQFFIGKSKILFK